MVATAHAPRLYPTPGCMFVARVAFDGFDRHFEPGDPFPYAELGLTEDFALNWWRAAMLEVAPLAAGGTYAVPAGSGPVSFKAARSDRIVVDPPSKKNTGKHKETS